MADRNWKCTECGKIYASNPQSCSCGYTVFQKTDENPETLLEKLKNLFI